MNDKPSKTDVKNAFDVLKEAGCVIETKARDLSDWTSMVFVVYVPLNMMGKYK